VSAIPPIGPNVLPPIGAASGTSATAPASGFGNAISKGLDSVASIENQADGLVTSMAAGGNVSISDVMAATSKANLGMSIVNEIRTRGLEAYQSIINVQI
jgi:flagellar hook-basal body complex protein FliE